MIMGIVNRPTEILAVIRSEVWVTEGLGSLGAPARAPGQYCVPEGKRPQRARSRELGILGHKQECTGLKPNDPRAMCVGVWVRIVSTGHTAEPRGANRTTAP